MLVTDVFAHFWCFGEWKETLADGCKYFSVEVYMDEAFHNHDGGEMHAHIVNLMCVSACGL